MSTISRERLADLFVEAADTLVDDFEVVDFLITLTSRAAELTDAAAGGLLLADAEGELHFIAATQEEARLLELFQEQSQEGPCQDCYRQGTPVVNADLAEASDRWPRFAPRAVAAGYRSVHAFPLRLRSDVIGALNLFGSESGTLDETDAHVVQALADVATIGILQERSIHRGDVVTEQLQAALNSRVVIEQAKGALSQLAGVGVDRAFDLMRDYARRNNRRLTEVAHAVVADPSAFADVTAR